MLLALPRVYFLNPRAPTCEGLRPAPTTSSPQYGCQRLWSQGAGPGCRAAPGPALSNDQPLPPASLPFGQRLASSASIASTIDLSSISSGEPSAHPSMASAHAMSMVCIASASAADSNPAGVAVLGGAVQPSDTEKT